MYWYVWGGVIVVNTDKNHSVMAVGRRNSRDQKKFFIGDHMDKDVSNISNIRVAFQEEEVADYAQNARQ